MPNTLAPEAILRAALRVLYVAAYTTRNWTLSAEVSRGQINDLWEALHNVPIVVNQWRGDSESLRDLRMYLREYDAKWNSPCLEEIFDHALEENGA